MRRVSVAFGCGFVPFALVFVPALVGAGNGALTGGDGTALQEVIEDLPLLLFEARLGTFPRAGFLRFGLDFFGLGKCPLLQNLIG